MLDQFEAPRNRGAIAIDADDARLRRLEDGPAVAAGAEGGVDINPAVARPQPGEHLAAEYRNMARTRGRLGHAGPPGEGGRTIRNSDVKESMAPQQRAFCQPSPVPPPAGRQNSCRAAPGSRPAWRPRLRSWDSKGHVKPLLPAHPSAAGGSDPTRSAPPMHKPEAGGARRA